MFQDRRARKEERAPGHGLRSADLAVGANHHIRIEYREHEPAIEDFKRQAESATP